MVICLEKGNGEADTVANVSYKGASALDMALWNGGNEVSQYLMVDLGMKSTDMDCSARTGFIPSSICFFFLLWV
jgi:hypothetical protein